MLHLSQIPGHTMLNNFPQYANSCAIGLHIHYFSHSSQEFLGYYQFSILKWEDSGPIHLKGIAKVTLVKRRKASVQPFLTASGPVQLFPKAKPPRQDPGAEGSRTARLHVSVLLSAEQPESPVNTTGLAISHYWPLFRGVAIALRLQSQSRLLHHRPQHSLASPLGGLERQWRGKPSLLAELWAMTIHPLYREREVTLV